MTQEKTEILKVEGLKAYYQMNYFGVKREVRAVDDITVTMRRNEVYGIAGESSSGKTSFIKVLAAAIRPPLRVIEGTVKYEFKNGPIDVAHASPAEIVALCSVLKEFDYGAVEFIVHSFQIGYDERDRQLLIDIYEACGKPIELGGLDRRKPRMQFRAECFAHGLG